VTPSGLNLSPARLLVLLALATVLQARYNATLPLSGDEAYYWVWSKLLQSGYHDHPPAIALAIRATTILFGDTIYGVRLVAALSMSGALYFITRMAQKAYGGQAPLWALGLGFILPMTQMGYVLATPDAPLVLAWAAAACFGLDAVAGSGRWRDFIGAGIFAGLAMTSKYTGILLPASVLVFVLIRRRDLLKSPRLWVAVGLAAAVFSPVLWWNYTQGFESFAFQYHHGTGTQSAILWAEFFQFLAGQLLVLSPVIFGLLALALSKHGDWRQNDQRFYLVTLFVVPMMLFLYKALFAKIQLNWAAPAYLTAIVLVAGMVAQKRLLRTAYAAILVAAIMVAALKWPLALGLTGKNNLHNRLFGGEQVATAITSARQPGDGIFADHLTRAALLQFQLPDHPRVMIPTDSRFSEYTRWDQGTDWPQLHGLYLSKDDHLSELTQIFGHAALLQVFTASKPGYREEKYYIYRVGQE
jgi:4-amino-4-deoxy-L-arabinose transferase-like glycosyltransferase